MQFFTYDLIANNNSNTNKPAHNYQKKNSNYTYRKNKMIPNNSKAASPRG